MKKQIIGIGAEAVLIKEENHLVKDRIKKSYRLPVLDEKLRRQRTKKEFKLLEKASKLIPVPKVLKTDEKEKIYMELIGGLKLSESLDSLKNPENICKTIGIQIAKLHDTDIIHGDLTTSNMIYSEKNNKVYFIDFGLGFESRKVEDKAVDLHLIKEALQARHFMHHEKFFAAVLDGYKASKHHKAATERLKVVEKRGRYKGNY